MDNMTNFGNESGANTAQETVSTKKNKINKNTFLIALGNVLELYDLSVYGFLSTTMAPLFFPSSSPLFSLIATFAVFTAGYMARPFGSIFFGCLAEKQGRKKVLILTTFIMTICTALIACMPTYSTIGIAAPLLLAGLRIIQGFSSGGEFPGSTIYILENQRTNAGINHGLALMACILGIFLGSLITTFFTLEWMPEYAWRIPFVIGACMGFIIFYLRTNLKESENFKVEKIQLKSILNNLWNQRKITLLTTLITAFCNVSFYSIFFFFSIFMGKTWHLSTSTSLLVNSGVLLLYMFAVLSFGVFYDYTRKIYINYLLILFTLSVFPVFYVSTINPWYGYMGQILLCVLVAGSMFYQHLFYIQTWPNHLRYSSISITYSLSASILGGSAPTVSLMLNENLGRFGVAGYLCLLALSSLALLAIFSTKTSHSLNNPWYDNKLTKHI